MANSVGGTLSVARDIVTADADGNVVIAVIYTNAAGKRVLDRQVIVPADRTKPILDRFGNQITASVPTALGNAITAFLSQIDSSVASAATAGKLDV